MVDDIAQVRGETVTLGLRQENFEQHPADVYAVVWTAAGGFGDPMERDPALVVEDWRNGAVTLGAARNIDGVVIDESSARLDADASVALRQGTRAARIARGGGQKPRRLAGAVALLLTDAIAVRIEGGTPHHRCARRHADLGPAHDNYKDHCLREDRPVAHAVPLLGDPARYIDATPEFRQFFCPGCGGLIENEIALGGRSGAARHRSGDRGRHRAARRARRRRSSQRSVNGLGRRASQPLSRNSPLKLARSLRDGSGNAR